jgi:amino acid transporter
VAILRDLTGLSKRLVVGRALRSDRLGETLLSKRIALPVFASDALSSVAYAPEEILLVLSVAGLAAYGYSPFIAAAVVVLMLTVVASYRQNVRAYPSGGGDYEVATVNLGRNAGLTVASALLVDYVLTVAVSVSAGVANFVSLVPSLATHKVALGLGIVAVITAMNLRGMRESGTLFAIPTYAFMFCVLGMIALGFLRMALGADLRAESSGFDLEAASDPAGLALVFLVMRSFSSGCAALTGVEAISNGVPAFRKPKSENAATTLLLMGVVAVSMFAGLIAMALALDVKVAENPAKEIVGAPAGYQQKTLITQVADAIFFDFRPGFAFVAVSTALILFLAANTAFNGFPVLGSILAQDRYLPRQLHTRGDRLAFSNGIVVLAATAMLLIFVFKAEVTRLIELYIIGVFVSFTLSQTGMVRHWTRLLREERDPARRRQMMTSRVINAFGLSLTGSVLVLVLVTKFLKGAWIVCVAMPVLFLLMKSIQRHYDRVAEELVVAEDESAVLPSRNHAVVLVSKIHKPTLRALSYARATRPSTLTAISVSVDKPDTERLQAEWDRRGLPVPLTVLDSPYREITRPVVDYVNAIKRSSPRDVVTVFIPEYVVGRWWEHLLHNQSALRLKARLLFTPGVMVTSVPWQLHSSELQAGRREAPAPGATRRGEPRDLPPTPEDAVTTRLGPR